MPAPLIEFWHFFISEPTKPTKIGEKLNFGILISGPHPAHQNWKVVGPADLCLTLPPTPCSRRVKTEFEVVAQRILEAGDGDTSPRFAACLSPLLRREGRMTDVTPALQRKLIKQRPATRDDLAYLSHRWISVISSNWLILGVNIRQTPRDKRADTTNRIRCILALKCDIWGQ